MSHRAPRADGRPRYRQRLRSPDRRGAESGPASVHVLVDDRNITVLDWTAALRAEPAYDVAFTSLLLTNPTLHADSG